MHNGVLNRIVSQGQLAEVGADRQRPQTGSLTAVTNLPLLLKQHTLLKILQVRVASIDTKPSSDSI
jgi:hypothetical protein